MSTDSNSLTTTGGVRDNESRSICRVLISQLLLCSTLSRTLAKSFG